MCWAPTQNRGEALLRVSEYSRAGWERGMLQSRPLSQDRKILLRPTRNLLRSLNPETESSAGLQ